MRKNDLNNRLNHTNNENDGFSLADRKQHE